jgi:hypothetical protein
LSLCPCLWRLRPFHDWIFVNRFLDILFAKYGLSLVFLLKSCDFDLCPFVDFDHLDKILACWYLFLPLKVLIASNSSLSF